MICGRPRDFDFGIPAETATFTRMSHKSARIAGMIESCQGGKWEAHYLGYFECFNREMYYEAHDVLEELWLARRDGPNYAFYKGLIQLAGAFVHLQKNRLRPAAALFKLAQANLRQYPRIHDELDVEHVLRMIEEWLRRLESADFAVNPLSPGNAPRLALNTPGARLPGDGGHRTAG